MVNSHVDQLIIEDNKAVGVRLKNGEEIRANQAVVCNLTPFTINKVLPETVSEEAKSYVQQNSATPTKNPEVSARAKVSGEGTGLLFNF